MIRNLSIVLLAYFLGSIPWAYLMGKWTRGIDIRQCGSGNVGFTNALRTLGKGPAAVVLVGDVSKGVLAVLLAKYFGGPVLATAAGLAVLTGHNCPVFLGFKGGKGAATGFGILLGLMPDVGLLGLLVWVLVILLTGYVSVGSIVAAICIPLACLLLKKEIPYIVFAVCGACFVVFKHHANIKRLINGSEPKISRRRQK